jgi:hypothetical protein
MNPLSYQTQAKFLQASRKRFADWGEANNHRLSKLTKHRSESFFGFQSGLVVSSQ